MHQKPTLKETIQAALDAPGEKLADRLCQRRRAGTARSCL